MILRKTSSTAAGLSEDAMHQVWCHSRPNASCDQRPGSCWSSRWDLQSEGRQLQFFSALIGGLVNLFNWKIGFVGTQWEIKFEHLLFETSPCQILWPGGRVEISPGQRKRLCEMIFRLLHSADHCNGTFQNVGRTANHSFPQQRKLMGSSAQISSGVCWCGSQEQVPEEGSRRFRRVPVCAGVCWCRFRRQLPEGSGGFRRVPMFRKVQESSNVVCCLATLTGAAMRLFLNPFWWWHSPHGQNHRLLLLGIPPKLILNELVWKSVFFKLWYPYPATSGPGVPAKLGVMAWEWCCEQSYKGSNLPSSWTFNALAFCMIDFPIE